MKFWGSSRPFPLDFLAFVVLQYPLHLFLLKEKLLLKFQARINHFPLLVRISRKYTLIIILPPIG